jgi:Tfp pilus assembly protein PilF
MYPEYPNFQMYLAMAYANQQDLARARVHFSQVLRLRAHDPMAHYQLGLIDENSGDEATAVDHYERAIASYGAFSEARYALGALLFRQGHYERAQIHLEQAVAGRPDDTAALHHLGMVHHALGDESAAKSRYERALTTEEDNVAVLNDLARLLATSEDPRLRNPNEALRLARRAAELTRYERFGHLVTLAAAAAAAARFDEAEKWQARAVELAPSDQTEALQRRLELYRRAQEISR